MQMLFFLAKVFLPPLLSGPLPTFFVFKMTAAENWQRRVPIVALLAIISNLAAFAIMIFELDGFLPAGFIACGLTPFAAGTTLIVSLRLLSRAESGADTNPVLNKWLKRSVIAISVLQLLMITILVIVAPSLCGTQIRTCTDY